MKDITDNYLIKQRLNDLRIELYSASQILRGDNLKEFKEIIREIGNLCGFNTIDTGTFIKVDND